MEPIIGAPQPGADVIKDTDTGRFEADVIEASRETPVVVDFWAPWCGPCKQLGPALENAVRSQRGKVRLAKVNVDENPQLAQALRIQSIPAVYAFADGRPVDGFIGALPESQINDFVARLAGQAAPSPAEQILERAKEALQGKDHGAASALFGQVLNAEPGNVDAAAGLARCYLAAGERARARELLDGLDPEQAKHPEVESARSALALAEQAEQSGDTGALQARLDSDPNDHKARFDLALALYAAGDTAQAIDHLLEIVRRDRTWNDEAARKQLLKIFEALGPTDALTAEGRRKLSSLLFA